MFAFVDCAFV